MIRVARSKPPSALAARGSTAAKERRAWVAYYKSKSHKKPGAEKPKFGAYRLKSVKKKLETMFHGKCAYCESRVEVVTWGDIEHYRPKGAIDFDNGCKKKPGYWWLGSSWENLLLACNRCNSVNRQEYEGKPGEVKFGKGNRFPIDGDDRAAWDEDDPHGWQTLERRERPLLLDPCSDDPRKSIECVTDEGERSGLLVALDERGKISIDVLGLNRKPLVDERRKKLKDLRTLAKDLRGLEDDVDNYKLFLAEARKSGDDARVKWLEDLLRQKMARVIEKRNELQEKAQDAEEYLLMTRSFVRSVLPPN